MDEHVLQLNFQLGVPSEEWENTAKDIAGKFAAVPGLKWKVWIMNEERREAGGIYMFESAEAMNTFLGSELAGAVKSHPAVKNMSAKPFGVLPEPTKTTRGPL